MRKTPLEWVLMVLGGKYPGSVAYAGPEIPTDKFWYSLEQFGGETQLVFEGSVSLDTEIVLHIDSPVGSSSPVELEKKWAEALEALRSADGDRLLSYDGPVILHNTRRNILVRDVEVGSVSGIEASSDGYRLTVDLRIAA